MPPVSRPCRKCKIPLEIECDMDWLWAPIMLLPVAMPVFIFSCLFISHHMVIAILICFVVCFFAWVSLISVLITPWCCNCAYSGTFFFAPARKVWQLSACQKCQNCESIGRQMRKLWGVLVHQFSDLLWNELHRLLKEQGYVISFSLKSKAVAWHACRRSED